MQEEENACSRYRAATRAWWRLAARRSSVVSAPAPAPGRLEPLRAGSCGRQAVHHRVLEHRRHRQRLPRGAELHRQGRGPRSGQVSKLTVIDPRRDAAGQLQDLRDLIAKNVNAIVFNPSDPKALNPALAEAKAAGIKTVAVDAYVTDPDTYNLYNNQINYAELGATWLFEQLGGNGTVYYMRGIAGHPADSDRDIGFKNALKNYPDIKVVPLPTASTPIGTRRPPPS